MFIRSERLFLRPGWPEDWNEILTQIADKAVVRNLASAPWPYTADTARAFAAQPQDRCFPHFLITMPSSLEPARVIGSIGLNKTAHGPELGLWIARDFWGRGYATEAASALLRLARTLGHGQVMATHFMDNPASGRVLRKVGFRPTGEVQPRYCMARGEAVDSAVHTIVLGQPSDCDDDNMTAATRAA